MGVRFPPPAPSKLKAYQLVGFFYVYQKCVFYAIHLTQHTLFDFESSLKRLLITPPRLRWATVKRFDGLIFQLLKEFYLRVTFPSR